MKGFNFAAVTTAVLFAGILNAQSLTKDFVIPNRAGFRPDLSSMRVYVNSSFANKIKIYVQSFQNGQLVEYYSGEVGGEGKNPFNRTGLAVNANGKMRIEVSYDSGHGFVGVPAYQDVLTLLSDGITYQYIFKTEDGVDNDFNDVVVELRLVYGPNQKVERSRDDTHSEHLR